MSLVIGETLCKMVEGLTVEEACAFLKTDVEAQLRDEGDVLSVADPKMKAFNACEDYLHTCKQQ